MTKMIFCTLDVGRDDWRDDVPVKPPFRWRTADKGRLAVVGEGAGWCEGEWCCMEFALPDNATMEEIKTIGESALVLWEIRYAQEMERRGS